MANCAQCKHWDYAMTIGVDRYGRCYCHELAERIGLMGYTQPLTESYHTCMFVEPKPESATEAVA